MDANPNSQKKIKGALWLDRKMVAAPGLQLEYKCDPTVCRYFPATRILGKAPLEEPVVIVEATVSQWTAQAELWAKQEAATEAEGPVKFDESVDGNNPWPH